MDFGVRWTVACLFANPFHAFPFCHLFPLHSYLYHREAIPVISKTLPISFLLGAALGVHWHEIGGVEEGTIHGTYSHLSPLQVNLQWWQSRVQLQLLPESLLFHGPDPHCLSLLGSSFPCAFTLNSDGVTSSLGPSTSGDDSSLLQLEIPGRLSFQCLFFGLL